MLLLCWNCFNVFNQINYITVCKNCRKVINCCEHCSTNNNLMCDINCAYDYIEKLIKLNKLSEEEIKQLQEWLKMKSTKNVLIK